MSSEQTMWFHIFVAKGCQLMLRILLAATLPLLTYSILFADEFAPIVDVDTLAASNCLQASCELPCSACNTPATWAAVDLLVWQPHMRSLDYAATEDGLSLAIGAGETHRVEFDRDAGFRVELGRMTMAGWGVNVTYTNFESSGVGSLDRPAGVGQLFSTLGHPGGPEEADAASASTNLTYNTFDLGVRTNALHRRFQSVDLFGGLRWANIDHELDAVFNGRDYVNGVIADRMEVDAFGLFFGGEASWRMAAGWSIFGRTSIAALYGKMQNTRSETNLNGLEQLVDFNDSYVDPIFNLDARVGLSKDVGRLQLRAGYDMNIWTGIGDRIRFADDIEEAAFSSASGDLLLEGFFFETSLYF